MSERLGEPHSIAAEVHADKPSHPPQVGQSPSPGGGVTASAAHFGDPCVFCHVAHDNVEPGPCPKNDGKVRVAGYAGLGVRWDGVESFRHRTTDGRVHELCSHVSNHSPYYHFGLSDELIQPPPYDAALLRSLVPGDLGLVGLSADASAPSRGSERSSEITNGEDQ